MIQRRPTGRFIFSMLLLAGIARGGFAADADSSFALYGAGSYSKVPAAVRAEFSSSLEDSSAFLSRVRLATNSFAQDPSIPFSELLSVYDAAAAAAGRFGYGDRIRSEREAIAAWAGKEGAIPAEAALRDLNAAIAIPRVGIPNILRRSTRIFAVSLVARRKAVSAAADPEWLFVAGKALDADTNSGDAFLESYLEAPAPKKSRHRGEALQILERAYRDQDGSRLSPEHEARLKSLRLTH